MVPHPHYIWSALIVCYVYTIYTIRELIVCYVSLSIDSGPGPGPYRRYDRLPPIQAQFSIESDSDMTESSGLIQEYDVFDPLKPRPHIIFIIGEVVWVALQANALYNSYNISATVYCYLQNKISNGMY